MQMIWRLVHSSWILHSSCNKRRVAHIASLLSSVLHPSLFSDGDMHDADNEPGPLKWVCGSSHLYVYEFMGVGVSVRVCLLCMCVVFVCCSSIGLSHLLLHVNGTVCWKASGGGHKKSPDYSSCSFTFDRTLAIKSNNHKILHKRTEDADTLWLWCCLILFHFLGYTHVNLIE